MTSDPAAPRLDTQTLELVGRQRLAGELLLAGLEVAFPARDRGVDLIAYADVDPAARGFVARPIQLKAASRRSFGVWRKYDKIHDLILAFVWHLDGGDPPETYALTHPEALAIAGTMGWLTTASWTGGGAYNTKKPGARLRQLLAPYRMDPMRWRDKIAGAVARLPSSMRLSRQLLRRQPLPPGLTYCSAQKSLPPRSASPVEWRRRTNSSRACLPLWMSAAAS